MNSEHSVLVNADARAHILLVDSKPHALLAFQNALQELGQPLVSARSAEEALRFLLHNDFAVIVLDVNLPDLHGFELAELIRRRERSWRTPIIFVSAASPAEASAFQGYALGAVDYIHDPRPEVIRAKVAVFVDLFNKTEEVKQYARALQTLNAELTDRVAERTLALQTLNAELEHRVAERTARLGLIQDITVVANEAARPEEVLQLAVQRICAYTGWPVGHVCIFDSESTDPWASVPIWHTDPPERFVAFQQATKPIQNATAESLIGRVSASGQPEWSVNLDAALECPQRAAAAAAAGLKTGFACPILMGREVVGVLEFYADVVLTPDASLLETIMHIGTQLGRAVERQRTALQLQRQQEALYQREKLAAMGSMLASVAHELNNPLASIMMQADLLREEIERHTLLEPVEEIIRAGERCKRLVRSFLTLARQHPPERGPVELNVLVIDTVELFARPLQVDNITVQLHLAEHLPVLWADRHQLQQVLMNLLANAQQALRESVTPRQVTVTTRCDPTRTRLTLDVMDTGPGIPLALQARIFEPFFTTKPLGLGTGLGLSLCRGIVEGHGGTMSVSSQPGQGATFHLELPVESMPDTASPPPIAAPPQAIVGKTILIVDDELSIARGLARLLSRDGYTVDMAANGRLALAKLQECAYDLLLSDLRMPDLDGVSFYRILKSRYPRLARRIIFLTGDTLSPETRAFLEHSTAPCLTKPFSASEVREAIQQALQTS